MEPTRSRSLLSETVALAITPIAAYAIAFSYEAGYLSHFGLPLWLIDLNLSRIFVVLSGLVFLLWIAYFSLVILPAKALVVFRWVRAFFIPCMMGYLTYVLLRLALHEHRAWWIPGLLMGLMTAYSAFVWVIHPLVTHRDQPTLAARLAISQREEALASPDTALDLSLRRLIAAGFDIRLPLISGFGFALLLPLAHLTGRIAAERQTFFLVEQSRSELVALRSYGDHLIVASVDTVQHEIGPVYEIQPLTTTPSVRWQLKYLGKLKVAADSLRPRQSPVRPDSTGRRMP
jgi:hypothetical protein